jgi:hypothetical protein
LYISMINDATMVENKLLCGVIVRDRVKASIEAANIFSYHDNHRFRISPQVIDVLLVAVLRIRPI